MLKPQSAKTIHEKSPSIFTICWISWEFQVCAKNPDILEKLVTLKYTWDHTYQEKKSWSKSSETCVPVPILLLMIWTWVKWIPRKLSGWEWQIFSQFSSVDQSCPTLCEPMNHSTPGLTVHHQLPEFTQTNVHRVGDAIQPSRPHWGWRIHF